MLCHWSVVGCQPCAQPLPVYITTTPVVLGEHSRRRTSSAGWGRRHCLRQMIQTRASITWSSSTMLSSRNSWPSKTVTLQERPRRRWHDNHSRRLKKEARRVERNFKAVGNTGWRARWRGALKNSRKLVHSKAAAYWKQEINEAGGSARRVLRTVDNLLGKTKSSAIHRFSPDDNHDFIDSKIADVRSATATASPAMFT